MLSLESVISVLAGWVILGQSMSPREILGCVLMFCAIILAQLPDRKKRLSECTREAGKRIWYKRKKRAVPQEMRIGSLLRFSSGQHFAHNAGEAVHLELVTGEAFGDGRGIFPGDFHPVELAVKVRYLPHEPQLFGP